MALISDFTTAPRRTRESRTQLPARIPRPYYPETRQIRSESTVLNQPIQDDDDERDWLQAGDAASGATVNKNARLRSLEEVRFLARSQPNVIQALRLYQVYLIGGGLTVGLIPKDETKIPDEKDIKVSNEATKAVEEFVKANRKWWSFTESVRRKYRDGEVFVRKVPGEKWPPQVRYIDPEEIDDPAAETSDTQGIVTDKDDISIVERYLRLSTVDNKLIENIPDDEMFHSKVGADSTQKRGISKFFSIRDYAKRYRAFLTNEVVHRNLQSSIVIHRKVSGSPGRVTDVMNAAKTSTTQYPEATLNREKIRPGTILTTNKNVEIEFRSPESNFSDASPLGKLLIMQIAAATGFPYYAVSADSGDANFASSLVQESPTTLMVLNERLDFGTNDIGPIIEWVILLAVRSKIVKWNSRSNKNIFDEYDLEVRFPSLETRDSLKEGQRINIGVMNGTLSRAEGSRQQQVSPTRMQHEIEQEMETDLFGGAMAAMNTQPNTMDTDNNKGGNQGDDGNKPGGDDDTGKARRAAQGQ